MPGTTSPKGDEAISKPGQFLTQMRQVPGAVAIIASQAGDDQADLSAVAAFECTLKQSHEYGTHTILIGQVEEMRNREGVSSLLYLDGQFAKVIGLSGDIDQ